MSFTSTTEIKSVTYKNWGYHLDNTYINNSGGFVSNDDYWQIKKPIDVSYEASVGGSFKIGGMTFFESNRTNVNFYSSTTVDSSKRISTVYISSQNQIVSVPSNAKIMIICVRTISPNEEAAVTITLRQKTIKWNTSDGSEPKSGSIYDYDGSINYQIGKLYDYDGTTTYQIGKVYDYNGTTSSLIYVAEVPLLEGQTLTNGVTAIDTRGSLNGNYGYNPLTIGSGGVTINTSTGNGNKRNSLMTLTPKINLTGYSAITFYFSTFSVKSMRNGDSFRVGVTTSAASNLGDYAMRGGTYQTWSSPSALTTKDYGPQTYTVDISSLSGEYYVYWDCSLQAQYSSSSEGWPEVNFTLNKICLE